MRKRQTFTNWTSAFAVPTLLLLLTALMLSTVQAAPPTQDIRPPVSTGGGTSGGGSGEGDNDSPDTSPTSCASLVGQVINWGFGGEGGVGAKLNAGGWQLATTSASDGNYGFGGLGTGIATLTVELAAPQATLLQPNIQNAAVYLNCEFPTIANVALANDDTLEEPATITISGPDSITQDNTIPLRLVVTNNLPNAITNVIVTSLMPSGLKATTVEAATVEDENRLKIIEGNGGQQLVFVYLYTLAATDETNIIINVEVDEEAPTNIQAEAIATLFYQESIATQAAHNLTISNNASSAQTAASSETDEVSTDPEDDTTANSDAQEAAQVEEESDTSGAADFVPPVEMPSTGGVLPILPQASLEAGNEVDIPISEETVVDNNEIILAVNPVDIFEDQLPEYVPLIIIDDPLESRTDTALSRPQRAESASPVAGASAVLFLLLLLIVSGLTVWRNMQYGKL
ncbi:MAG: hypothetical protein AAF485_24325 [Chloroflexota bacterium]